MDPYAKNYGKTKDGELKDADNITSFTCYQCLHTVDWLNEDSRCKDCTRLTVNETQGTVDIGPDACRKCGDEDCTGWCDCMD